MKKLLIISLLNILVTQLSFGQKNDTSQPSTNGVVVSPVSNGGLYVGSGASVHIAGSGSLTLENSILENKGTVTDGTGTMHITGNSTSGIKIEGDGQTSLHHLTINKSAGDLSLEKNISVAGDLTLSSGNVSLVSGNVEFGSTGKILGEAETQRIFGTGGYLQTTVDLNAPASQNPANLGIKISSNANLGSTIIKRTHTPVSVYNGSTSSSGGIQRAYELSPTNNSGLNANLTFSYFDAELNNNPESSLCTWKSVDTGTNWDKINSSLNPNLNEFQINGEDVLGSYTGHIDCPTVSISSNSPVCEGFDINLMTEVSDTSATTTYSWTGPNAFTSDQADLTIAGITPNKGGIYTLAVTEGICSITSTVEVVVHPLPDIPTITADNMSICKGGSAVLTGNCSTANSSFRWLTAQFNGNQTAALPQSNLRTISEPGIYKGLCESDKGCLSAEVSITITEAENCNGQNFITISPEKPAICPGGSILMTASGCTGTLSWLGGVLTEVGASVSLSPPTTTTYLVQCSTGGSATFTLNVAANAVAVNSNVTTGKERFKAVTTLTSDKKVGDANFTPGAHVIFEAGNSITLLPGFTAEKWSIFKAEIKTCN